MNHISHLLGPDAVRLRDGLRLDTHARFTTWLLSSRDEASGRESSILFAFEDTRAEQYSITNGAEQYWPEIANATIGKLTGSSLPRPVSCIEGYWDADAGRVFSMAKIVPSPRVADLLWVRGRSQLVFKLPSGHGHRIGFHPVPRESCALYCDALGLRWMG